MLVASAATTMATVSRRRTVIVGLLRSRRGRFSGDLATPRFRHGLTPVSATGAAADQASCDLLDRKYAKPPPAAARITTTAITQGTALPSEPSSVSSAAAWSASVVVVEGAVVVVVAAVVVGAAVVAGTLPGPPGTRSSTGPGAGGSGAPSGHSSIHRSTSPLS